MDLTQAQETLFDIMNQAAIEENNIAIEKDKYIDMLTNKENPVHAFVKAQLLAMETYAEIKWVEACHKMWNEVNEAMGDQSIEDSIKICNVKHPKFEP